ncbi:Ada metal-binding domain-containing protein [Lacrimispora sp. BS-2]|uniref:Ada metal-binding domain-containing protein n=1 Tax=Lacrimispora sp. BS-2 TaxID=3151850 RepID=A0AAU7PU05_9FIRM
MKNDVGLYAAFKAKDARFDGRFLMGVSSTGIYIGVPGAVMLR